MPFEFPYTDLHEINLNKFIKAVKNLLGGHGGELLQKQSNIPFDYAWKPVTGLTAVNSVNGMTGNVTLTATDVGAIPNTTPIPEPANNLPADLGVAYRGTSLKYARMDHVHKMPTASDVGALPVGTTIPLPGLNAPADLGTAYRGTATRYSREDHVHNMPSASDVGALADNTLYAGSQTAGGPADKAVSIPMGALDASSTSTVMKASVAGITELRNGVLMWLRNGVVSSASGVTLNINNLGAKPIYSSQSASSVITTLFNVNYTALMIYNEDRVAGGCWDYVYGYDSNTNTIGYQIRTYAQSLPMQSITYRYRLLFTSKDHKHFVPANNSTSTNSTTARTPCQDPIDPFGPLYYYGTTASVASGTKPSVSYLWQQYAPITLGYSFTGYTLTAFAPVFLVCTPNADGSAVINSSTPITQTLPNTADGKIYILLGVATTTTAFELILSHPIYYHDGIAIKAWTGKQVQNPISKIVTYSGTDLSTIFANASALHDAISAGDFSNIHIGDYWPITINGSYKDVAKFTVPSGITYYNDANLTTVGGTTSSSYEGTYQTNTAIKFWIGGTAKYCATGDCTQTYMVPINVNLKMEVASINPYIGTGDTEFSANHVLLCSRELLNRFQMRVNANTWYDATKTNPWRGSHLWETLNNATDGVIKLVESTPLGPYVYSGPNNQGMRVLLPTMGPGVANPAPGSWNDRGRLFIPTEMETYGSPVASQTGGYLGTYQAEELFNQWPLFQGTTRHLIKTLGNHGRTQWWLQNAINANTFCTISNAGVATTYSAGTAYGVPLCFLII